MSDNKPKKSDFEATYGLTPEQAKALIDNYQGIQALREMYAKEVNKLNEKYQPLLSEKNESNKAVWLQIGEHCGVDVQKGRWVANLEDVNDAYLVSEEEAQRVATQKAIEELGGAGELAKAVEAVFGGAKQAPAVAAALAKGDEEGRAVGDTNPDKKDPS